MKISIILTLFLIISNLSIINAQDSLLQIEISKPIFIKTNRIDFLPSSKEKTMKIKYGPSILIQIPIYKRLSISTGAYFRIIDYEFTFDNYQYRDPTVPNMNFIHKINSSRFDIILPIIANYNLYNKKKFYIDFSFGHNSYAYFHTNVKYEFFPTDSVDSYASYFKQSNLTYANESISLNLKYYILKHLSLFIKPLFTYELFDSGTKVFEYGIKMGICYK